MEPVWEDEYVEYVTARLRWLRGIAYALCRDWHEADELTQATVARLYVHWRRVRAARHIDSYARTVLVRTYVSMRRAWWRRRVRLVDEPPTLAVVTPDVATRVAVRAALARVPPKQRAALILRYYLDLSVAETAEALECSEGTVKSQTARGLAAMRAHLADDDAVTTKRGAL